MKEKLFQIKLPGPKSESITKFYEAILAFGHPIRSAVDYLDRISKGNVVPLTREENRDGFNVFNSNLGKLISTVDGINQVAKDFSKFFLKCKEGKM